jgi:hypothetical protein
VGSRIAAVDFIPKALIVGVFAAVQPGPAAAVTEEKLNRIWGEVAPRQRYRQLQLAGDGSGAQFLGATADDGVTIQLPLIQVRETIKTSAAQAAGEIQTTFRIIAKHLGIAQFFNLGVKHVYHAPIPTNDARDFVLQRLLRKSEDEVGMLDRGEGFWAGLKYGAAAPDGSQFVLTLEPWLADDRYVFLDLDAQFPGAVSIDAIKDRAAEAEEYLGAVKEYLDRADPAV